MVHWRFSYRRLYRKRLMRIVREWLERFYDHSAFGFNGYSLIESRAGRDMGSYSFLLPCVMAAYV